MLITPQVFFPALIYQKAADVGVSDRVIDVAQLVFLQT